MFDLIIKKDNQKKGFTAVEMIIVVAIISLLAGSILWSFNTNKAIGKSYDVMRWKDIKKILAKVIEYSLDNKGLVVGCANLTSDTIPADGDWRAITNTNEGTDICNLSSSLADYMVMLPEDPTEGDLDGTGDTGYKIMRDSRSTIYIKAPHQSDYAEEDIEVNSH